MSRLLVGLSLLVSIACAGETDTGALDASIPSTDGGVRDAAMVSDAHAAPDAYVAPDAYAAPDAYDAPDAGSDANVPDAFSVDAAALPDASGCASGTRSCGGACIAPGTSCGAPATCSGGACTCPADYRMCPSGCCPTDLLRRTTTTLWGDDVRMQITDDGTFYVLVAQRLYPTLARQLALYALPPGGSLAVVWSMATGAVAGGFDLVARADGSLVIAFIASDASAQRVVWTAGSASAAVRLGSAAPYSPLVRAARDADGNVWLAWSDLRSGFDVLEIAPDGTTSTMTAVGGDFERGALAINPTTDEVFAFWGSIRTGTYTSGALSLSGTTTLTSLCGNDDVAFDSTGHEWSIWTSYLPVSYTYVCHDGAARGVASILGRANPYGSPRIAVDGEDTMFISMYDDSISVAMWLDTRDQTSWAYGGLGSYGITSAGVAGDVFTALARDPEGRMNLVVVPQDTVMGPGEIDTFLD